MGATIEHMEDDQKPMEGNKRICSNDMIKGP